MATCTPQTLMDDAGCFACLNPEQLQVIIASILCKIAINTGAMATCDPATLMSDAKCFACLTPQQLQILQTQLLCEIYTNLGGPGSGIGSILCGVADPTIAPTTSCAFYYRTDNGGVWFWDNATTAWKQLIAP